MNDKNLGILIKQLNDALIKNANNGLRDTGLTFSQMCYLTYLKEHKEGVPFKQLEVQFNVSQPTAVGVVSRLEKKGLLTTGQNAQDSRAKDVYLTEEGEKLLVEVEKRKTYVEERIFSDLSPEERKNLRSSLLKMLNALKDS